jgi:hypothetical protein
MTLVFLVTLISVPVYAKKAGEVKEGIYTDVSHNFSFEVPSKWSIQVKKEKSALRLAMEEKSPVPPQQFQGELRDYMQIPTIKVLVDTTSLTCEKFIEMLLDPKFKSKQKKFIMKSLSLISRPHEILKSSDITFGGIKATMLTARQAYTMEVSQRGSDRADVINDHKMGAIFFTIREGKVFIFHMICEYKTSGPLLGTFDAVISSLKFNGAEEMPEAESSG